MEPAPNTSKTEEDGPATTHKNQTEVKVIGVSFLLNTVAASADPLMLDDDNVVLGVADLHPGMLVNG